MAVGAFVAGSIVGKLLLDKKKWDTSVKAVGDDSTKMQGWAARNSEKFGQMGRAMTVAGGVIVGSLVAQISKASDAEETFSKFGTVFAESLGQASAAAADLAENYGLSELKAKTLLSATGDLLTGMGANSAMALDLSTKTQQLAVDLASFTNYSGGATGASEALTKAMLGERESLKSLGIVVSEEMIKQKLLEKGQQDLTGSALLQAKAYATLEIATSQSKNAIGDFARTSDSFANQQRILQSRIEDLRVEIGSKLLPIATKIVSGFADITKKIVDWTKKNPELTSTIVKITLGLGGLLLAFGPLLIILPKLMLGFTAIAKLGPILASSVGALGKAFVFLATNPIGLLILALGALVVGYMKVKAAQDRAEASAQTAFETNKKYMEKLKGAALQAGMTATEFYDLSKAYDNNAAALGNAIRKGEEGEDMQKSLAKVGAESAEVYNAQKTAIDDSLPSMTDFNAALEGIGGTAGETQEKIKTWIDYLSDLGLKTIKEKSDKVILLEGYLEDLHGQYRAGKLDLETYRQAVEATETEIKNLSTTVVDTAIPTARDFGTTFEEALDGAISKTQDFPGAIETETKKVKTAWGEMADGLQTKWASSFGDILRGTTSFKDALKGIWGSVKDQFFDMIGQMVAKWTFSLITDLASATKDGAAAIGQTLGAAVESTGTAITSLTSSLIGIIPALATAIASAATTLAAAAPAILVVGAIALGLYAGFKIISGLLSKGKGGQELRAIKDNTWAMKMDMRNMVNNQDFMKEKVDWSWGELKHANLQLDSIKRNGWTMAANLDAIKKAGWKRNTVLRDRLGKIITLLRGGGGGKPKPAPDLGGDGGGDGGTGDTATQTSGGGGAGETTGGGGSGGKKASDVIDDMNGGTGGGGAGGSRVIIRNMNLRNVIRMEGLIITDKQYTRNRMIPELIAALKANLHKAELQKALGLSG